MKIGKAFRIFEEINSDEYTEDEKVIACYHVLQAPTHNSINKDKMLAVAKWLFDKSFEVSESEED